MEQPQSVVAARLPWQVYGSPAAYEPGSDSQQALTAAAIAQQGETGRAIEITADHIISLIEEEKNIVLQAQIQRYRDLQKHHEAFKVEQGKILAEQAAKNNDLSNRVTQLTHELSRVAKLLDSRSQPPESQHSTDKNKELESKLESLKQEAETYRLHLQQRTSEAGLIMNQMGVYSTGSGYYSFADYWLRLFEELGIALARPVHPAELPQTVDHVTLLLKQRSGGAPNPPEPQSQMQSPVQTHDRPQSLAQTAPNTHLPSTSHRQKRAIYHYLPPPPQPPHSTSCYRQ